MNETAFRLLTAMRERLQNHPAYLANSFRIYQQQTSLDDQGLAKQLHTDPQQVLRLALCKCPDTAAPAFTRQVEELAAYAEVDATRLAHLIKEAQRLQRPLARKTRQKVLAAVPTAWRGFTLALPKPLLPLLTSVLILAAVYTGVRYVTDETTSPPALAEEPTHQATPAPERASSGSPEIANAPTATAGTTAAAQPAKTANAHSRLQPNRKRAAQEVTTIAFIKVDLTEHQTLRQAQREEPPRKSIRLPQARTRILFTLPEGSPNGIYSVLIVDAFNKPLVSRKAKSTDGKTLNVTLDASVLEEKTYRLCISRKGEAPGYYQVIVEKEKNPRK